MLPSLSRPNPFTTNPIAVLSQADQGDIKLVSWSPLINPTISHTTRCCQNEVPKEYAARTRFCASRRLEFQQHVTSRHGCQIWQVGCEDCDFDTRQGCPTRKECHERICGSRRCPTRLDDKESFWPRHCFWQESSQLFRWSRNITLWQEVRHIRQPRHITIRQCPKDSGARQRSRFMPIYPSIWDSSGAKWPNESALACFLVEFVDTNRQSNFLWCSIYRALHSAGCSSSNRPVYFARHNCVRNCSCCPWNPSGRNVWGSGAAKKVGTDPRCCYAPSLKGPIGLVVLAWLGCWRSFARYFWKWVGAFAHSCWRYAFQLCFCCALCEAFAFYSQIG